MLRLDLIKCAESAWSADQSPCSNISNLTTEEKLLLPIAEATAWYAIRKGGLTGDRIAKEAYAAIASDALSLLYGALSKKILAAFLRTIAADHPASVFDPSFGSVTDKYKSLYDAFLRPESILSNEHVRHLAHQESLFSKRAIASWIHGTKTLLQRISQHAAKLSSIGQEWKLTSIDMKLGDSHRIGQRVSYLRFSCGSSWIYKPRCILPELEFSRLLTHLLSQDFTTIEALDCGNFGFIRPVVGDAKIEDRTKTFEGYGRVLCLLHILNATDMNCENITVSEGLPIPLDIEAILHPFAKLNKRWSSPNHQEVLDRSILRVGILPDRLFKNTTISQDGSALGTFRRAASGSVSSSLKPISLPPNTIVTKEDMNLLYNGYKETYLELISMQPKQLYMMLRPFAFLSNRIILRNTTYYFTLISEIAGLKNDQLRPFLKEKLAEHGVLRTPIPKCYVKKEMTALLRGDIPVFSGTRHAHALRDLRSRLRTISTNDLEAQRKIIKASASLFPAEPVTNQVRTIRKSLSDSWLRERLSHIGGTISECFIEHHAGSMLLGIVEQDSHFSLSSVNSSLYDGTAGIAAGLSSVSKILGDEHLINMSIRMMRDLPLNSEGTNISTGLPGVIASHFLVSRIFGIPIEEPCKRKLEGIIRSICSASDGDYLGGSAGVIALGNALLSPREIGANLCANAAELLCSSNLGSGFAHGKDGVEWVKRELNKEKRELDQPEYYRFTHSDLLGWCRGKAGLLGSFSNMTVPCAIGDFFIDSLKAETISRMDTINDSLCCGISGIINVLLDLSQSWGGCHAHSAASEIFCAMIIRANDCGGFCIDKPHKDLEPNLGLFNGLAGVGYTISRFLEIEVIPSPLIFKLDLDSRSGLEA